MTEKVNCKSKEWSNIGSTIWIEGRIFIWLVIFRLSGLNFNNELWTFPNKKFNHPRKTNTTSSRLAYTTQMNKYLTHTPGTSFYYHFTSVSSPCFNLSHVILSVIIMSYKDPIQLTCHSHNYSTKHTKIWRDINFIEILPSCFYF